MHTLGMAEARDVKLCTQGDYIKSCQTDDTSSRKGHDLAQVTHFCVHICGPHTHCSLPCYYTRHAAQYGRFCISKHRVVHWCLQIYLLTAS